MNNINVEEITDIRKVYPNYELKIFNGAKYGVRHKIEIDEKEVYKELAQLLAYKTIGHTGFSKVSISIKKDITTNKYNVRVKATEPFGTDTYKWEYYFHQVEL